MEVGARPGWRFDFSAMFDRTRHPARGRDGGDPGAPTTVTLTDGTPKPGKGRFPVPEGQTVRLAFPGGGGIGDPRDRPREAILRDLRLGYISEDTARTIYGLTDSDQP